MLKPTIGSESRIEPRPSIVECVFLAETKRRVLVILFKISTHSNVDALIKFFRLLSKCVVRTMDMNQLKANPCVFYKLDEKCKLMLIMSAIVDDCAVADIETGIN